MENLTDESCTFFSRWHLGARGYFSCEKAVRGDKHFGRYQSVQNVSSRDTLCTDWFEIFWNRVYSSRFGYYSSLCLSVV
jgi:hypothetical protein